MEPLWQGIKIALERGFLKTIIPYLKAWVREPLLGAILVGLIILFIIGYVTDRKERINEDHSHSKPKRQGR